MRKSKQPQGFVVYRMTVPGKLTGMNAVCEQSEWEAMEKAQPGYHTLIKEGIENEGEAERLARSGLEVTPPPKSSKRKSARK
jgi:hypothetical protein